ncbi:MinD/ParA family ATP-binding protein [Desulfotalea psychrophila]|uniref:Related to ATP-binding proteins n=1 Tax=Desulfotalea psychrophila (strain LSv54 / DSM 12343) TaxID=177439 RepID=Q6ALS5_DESPS|nr:P-loop NTPase [Desulfotalea psychrophila]CAG36700.1 related to ATP-binding proteins [Desulfotalea psychrophila LSv54]
MAITISVGSGKGGVGKSIAISNIALLLAKAGKKVCIVDFDIGGADTHILFGLFQPKYTLTDFLDKRVETIQETIQTMDVFYGLQLIPGTGDTLQTANMNFQQKQRLLRAIGGIDADVILFDVGAGTNYHTLDFFMATDIQMCVAMPEPTSIMDFYTFLQLATIRKTLSKFLSSGDISQKIKNNRFSSLDQALELIEEMEPGGRQKAQESLRYFNPLLIINRVTPKSKLNRAKLHKMASRYLGIYLPDLGDIPHDETMSAALKAFMPIAEYDPKAPASIAFQTITHRLLKILALYEKKAGKSEL